MSRELETQDTCNSPLSSMLADMINMTDYYSKMIEVYDSGYHSTTERIEFSPTGSGISLPWIIAYALWHIPFQYPP